MCPLPSPPNPAGRDSDLGGIPLGLTKHLLSVQPCREYEGELDEDLDLKVCRYCLVTGNRHALKSTMVWGHLCH